ncbi:MAG: CinA family protein [Chitinophagaceae bacterium]
MYRVENTQGEKIRNGLLSKGKTIAVAESVTAGLLQYALSTIPDASKFLQGGITAFNVAQKYKHLRVEPLHALSVNCVSGKVAEEMALHCCELFSSDWGVGITGYASPAPESGNKSFAYFAIAFGGRIVEKGKLSPKKKDPPAIQQEYVSAILSRLEKVIKR